ncbi:hypothetical protein HX109_11125 [Galbibacter sp. BG1]|uniref:hypothetical protein n=1 Tax=Galbibacter sp. BG1 TaxID=1170699 RepID=UPI0015C16F64|nr:hypothetical protein [Galbibacter sp. BG1]QLE02080.1 hypothetical protein HX109_11125 [Galbibacter sp. BG1]
MNINHLHTNKSGFKTPENYLSDFEKDLSVRLSEENLPKGNAFTTPDDYFSEVEKSILAKTTLQKETEIIKVSWFYKAASIAAIFMVVFFIAKNLQKPSSQNFDTIATAEIDAYIDEGYLNLNTYDITDTFNEVSLSNIEISDAVSDDDIFKYLEENMTRYNGIYIENE